jgi:hypothetical protein
MAQRRAAQWPRDVRAREDLHARRAVEDSNLVWEQTSPEKQGARQRRAVPSQGKWRAAQTRQVALQQASSSQVFVVQQTSAGQKQLPQAGRPA